MASNSEGRRQLGQVLSAGATLDDVASTVGVTDGAVSHWATGTFVPSYKHMLQLAKHYGIPLDAWGRPPEVHPAPLPAHPNESA